MDSSNQIWMGLSYSLAQIVQVGATVWLLVVVVRTVRLHRPDAWKGLCVAVALSLATIVIGGIATIFLPLLASRSEGGLDSYFRVMAIQSLFFTALHVVYNVLFIPGIAKLARPPVEVKPEGAPPYR
jgi:hypothetical protein